MDCVIVIVYCAEESLSVCLCLGWVVCVCVFARLDRASEK